MSKIKNKSEGTTMPVEAILPGDVFSFGGHDHWTAEGNPEIKDDVTIIYVRFLDGGYSHRVWDKGTKITVRRDA